MGRPTKIEGNPEHPASLGATDARGQADILNLYDPDRSRTLTYLGDIRVWDDFVSALKGALDAQRGLGGSGLRILTETITSPTLGRADRRDPEGVPGGEMAPVGAGRRPQRARGRRAGIRPAGGHASTTSRAPTSC